MRILLTGPTSSAGKTLLENLTNYEFVTCPHTEYDLNNINDIQRIVELSTGVDHFINLANVGTSQSILLQGVHDNWSSAQKVGKIISFGTLATIVPFDILTQIGADSTMIANKMLLEKVHNELSIKQVFGPQPQSVLIRFANFDEEVGRNQPYTTKQQLVDMLNFIINSNTYISTVDFREI